jgi:hypothetical protein
MPAPSGPTPVQVAEARNRALTRSGARWFYWIAGLSIVNSLLFITGAKLTFLVGLGMADAANAIAQTASKDGSGLVIALAFDVLLAGGFIGLAYMAEKAARWAFIVGLIVYGLDALLMVWAADWLSVAFHGLALYFIYRGFQACWALPAAAAISSVPPGMAPPIHPR